MTAWGETGRSTSAGQKQAHGGPWTRGVEGREDDRDILMTREDTTHFDHEQLSARSIRRREWRRELTKREEKYGGGREF